VADPQPRIGPVHRKIRQEFPWRYPPELRCSPRYASVPQPNRPGRRNEWRTPALASSLLVYSITCREIGCRSYQPVTSHRDPGLSSRSPARRLHQKRLAQSNPPPGTAHCHLSNAGISNPPHPQHLLTTHVDRRHPGCSPVGAARIVCRSHPLRATRPTPRPTAFAVSPDPLENSRCTAPAPARPARELCAGCRPSAYARSQTVHNGCSPAPGHPSPVESSCTRSSGETGTHPPAARPSGPVNSRPSAFRS